MKNVRVQMVVKEHVTKEKVGEDKVYQLGMIMSGRYAIAAPVKFNKMTLYSTDPDLFTEFPTDTLVNVTVDRYQKRLDEASEQR